MNRPAAPVPGSLNQFDSDTYLALITAKGVIDQTKTDLINDIFPPNQVAIVKKSVNDLITYYNVSDTAYTAYHAASLAGTATLEQQQAVQATVDNLNKAVVAVSTAKAGN